MSWVAVAVTAAVASAGLAGYSAASQADAQKKTLNYQAQVAANNAKIAAWNRSSALQQGEIDAEQSMQKQAQLLGEQRAALSANGLDIKDHGSALDLLASTKFTGAQDVNTIQSNAARQAWGYDVQGMNVMAESNLDTWKADSIDPAAQGALAGGSSLLSSASSFAAVGVVKGGGGGGTKPFMKIRPNSGTGW